MVTETREALGDAEIDELRERTKTFMDEHIYPNEGTFSAHDDAADALMRDLQGQTKAMGMWAPHLPAEAGGMGIGFMPYVYMNEILGRSPFAPKSFGAQAPDSGNAEILWQFGTPEQQERWMKPLVEGEITSCFSMTEPDVSGADPTNLQTTAVRDGDEWVINGHKWFTSGALNASFAIVMCVTEPDQPPHSRMSQIIVPTDTPGFDIIRPIVVMGDTDGHHCEIRYNDVRVPITNVLGEAGGGFRIAQKRLGPGRIHHCMRWLGQSQRAFEIMCEYSLKRQVFGGPLADKQTIQNWIADSYVENPGGAPADPAGGGEDRYGRRGARGDLGDQVLRGEGAARRHRPRDPDAWGARRQRRHAAGVDVPGGSQRAHLRRSRRDAPDGGIATHPAQLP